MEKGKAITLYNLARIDKGSNIQRQLASKDGSWEKLTRLLLGTYDIC